MRKVIGIGETVLDIIFRNEQPINAVPGGSAFNAMISLGRCGVNSTFISEAGNDRIGTMVINFLEENGVDASNVNIFPDSKSPVSLAFLDENNNANYIFYKDHPHDQLEFVYPEINPDDIVLFGSFFAINPVVRPQVAGFLQYAHDHGAILYYDINYRSSHEHEIMKITPNLLENLELSDIVRGSNEDFEILYKKDTADKGYNAEISFYCIHLHPRTPANRGTRRKWLQESLRSGEKQRCGKHHWRWRQLQRRLHLRTNKEQYHTRRYRPRTYRSSMGQSYCFWTGLLCRVLQRHLQLCF